MSTRDRINEYRQLIYALPQAGVLQEDDVERWLDGMTKRADRLEETAPALLIGRSGDTEIRWHIRRASGIGGSESGTALLHERKEYWMDVSLPRLVDQKLFKTLPDESNEHMQRGTLLEPVAQRMFHNTYGARTDEAARAAMRDFPGWPAHPWLLANEDDVVLIGSKRFLVDYKFTAEPADEVALMYKAQLHHNWTKGRLAGVKFDGLLLVAATMPGAETFVDAIKQDPAMIDHALAMADALSKSRDSNTSVNAFRVDFSLDFAKDLIRANQRVWDDYVLTGTRPRFFRRDRAELSESQQEDGAKIAARYARYKALADNASELAKAEGQRLTELLDGTDLGNKKQPFPLLTLGQRDNMDLDAAYTALTSQGVAGTELSGEGVIDLKQLAAAATAAGVDLETCRKQGKPDKKKIIKALDQAGLEHDEFSKPSLTVGLTRSKKGAGFEQLDTIRGAAQFEVDAFAKKDLSISEPDPEPASNKPAPRNDDSAGDKPAPGETDKPAPQQGALTL